jgi:hypothetical protein
MNNNIKETTSVPVVEVEYPVFLVNTLIDLLDLEQQTAHMDGTEEGYQVLQYNIQSLKDILNNKLAIDNSQFTVGTPFWYKKVFSKLGLNPDEFDIPRFIVNFW